LYNFDPERKKALIENILITGGCSAINGIQKRMEKELLGALASSDQIITEAGASGIKLLEVPKYIENLHKKQHYADWLGASITAKLVFPQQQMYITRADYNEFGPNIIHVKVPG
jgi:actin-related protein